MTDETPSSVDSVLADTYAGRLLAEEIKFIGMQKATTPEERFLSMVKAANLPFFLAGTALVLGAEIALREGVKLMNTPGDRNG